ncbi:hemin receptor [Corynebacterium sp. HS2168-gen11]|uniref:hemin receptor n=1 Tax=Corynebacterium sp. HS2168-gen11 TaxID=2974027 RepID=UPI00216AE4B3|nr:hemin receptor [Corynebacterium sp. HS2168-gen11]MCS4535895.1 hemin receptor [Corynebacterium sp. HS2168-gen11]
MNALTMNAFHNLYPDVDPTQSLPLTRVERLSIAAAGGLTSFGFTFGDIIFAGTGLALLIFTSIAPGVKTARRIRKEARDRFPQLDWQEKTSLSPTKILILMSLFWITIIVINISIFWYMPKQWHLYGSLAAALLTVMLLWIMPGTSPLWSASRHTNQPSTP